jgi:predicted permease
MLLFRHMTLLRTLYDDVRYAVRLIAANRTVSLAVFLSLTIGIAASASMFGAVDALLFRPLQVPQTSRIVRVTSVTRAVPLGAISYPDFDDLQKRSVVFEGFATAQELGAAVSTQNDGRSRITFGLVVNADFLRTLRLEPVIGRSFRPEEDAVPGRDAVAMISYSMWQRDFAGKPDVIGKTIRVITTDFTIIGVVPSTFTGLNPLLHPEFYVPRMMAQALADPGVHPLTDRSVRMAAVYGRLKPAVSIGQASAEAASIASQLEQENPATNRGQSMTTYTQVGFRIAEDPGDFKIALLFLLIGALVLCIACANVGNLLLSLAPARVRETAVRFAMGARRGQLIRQFIIESCVISAAATVAGLSIAALVARFIRSVEIGNGFVPITIEMQADARVALFAFTVGVGSGILSALIPAFRCSRGNLGLLMRSADPRVARTRTRFREFLVGAQVALATIVLVLSGLALESLALLKKADPGFRFDHVLAAAFDATMGRSLSIAQAHRFYAQLLERVRNMPGVESAGLGHHVPLGLLGSSIDVVVEGYAMPEGQNSIRLPSTIVGDGYFDTLRIPLLRGRAFDNHDTADAPKVVIINEAMAEKYWPGRDALGARVEIRTPKPETAEVIGIARNGKYRSFDEQSSPFIYRPLAQTEESFIWIFVATKDDPVSFIPTLRNVVREIDPAEPIYDVRAMADVVRRQALWSDRLTAQIATGVGVAGLVLGILGLYGMLAYSVSRRTREIGIRMALGATSPRVYSMIVFQGLRLSIGGIFAGLIMAGAVTTTISDVLAPADPQNPIVYGSVVAVLLAVTLLASYHPARRAARVDPNECLRSE